MNYVNRLESEKKKLDLKLNKLKEFLDCDNKTRNISIKEISLMLKQQKIMEDYSKILEIRLELYK